MACDSIGSFRTVDLTKFDRKFTCECLPTSEGENCEKERPAVGRSRIQGNEAATSVAWVLGSVAVVVGCMATAYRIWLYKKKVAPANFTHLEVGQRPCEIRRGRVTLLEKVDSGSFGEVWKASLQAGNDNSPQHNTLVAVKLVKLREPGPVSTSGGRSPKTPSEDEVRQKRLLEATSDLLDEAILMAKVGFHENVLSIVGVSTIGYPKLLIISYCEHGSLLHVLKNSTLKGTPISPSGKLELALGVLQGMAHLIANKVIHRDLAARNVLLSSGNTQSRMVPRVADFGLSRVSAANSSEDYYRSTNGVFAIRWTSPEAMNSLKFTEASDVWSFGILLVEMLQDGGRPYPGIKTNPEVYTLTISGSCHWQPAGCSDLVYDIMTQCWSPRCSDRPSFSKLVTTFCKLTGHHPSSTDTLINLEPRLGGARTATLHNVGFYPTVNSDVPKLPDQNIEHEYEYSSTAIPTIVRNPLFANPFFVLSPTNSDSELSMLEVPPKRYSSPSSIARFGSDFQSFAELTTPGDWVTVCEEQPTLERPTPRTAHRRHTAPIFNAGLVPYSRHTNQTSYKNLYTN
jgi:serine/threonine protein kinase